MTGFEIFGVLAGIDGAIEGSKKLYQFISDLKNAKKEKVEWRNRLKGFIDQLQSINLELEKGKEVKQENPFMFEELERLCTKDFLDGMNGDLNRLISKMVPQDGAKQVWKYVVWTKDKSDIVELMNQVAIWRDQLKFALDHDQRATVRIMHDLVKQDAQDREEEKRHKAVERITAWLSPLNFDTKHNALLETENRINLTQDVIRSEEFTAWRSGEPFILSCHADAGAGKTVLVSMIIEGLQSYFKDQNVAILYLYLDHKDQKTQTPLNLMGSLLQQLILCKKPAVASEHLVQLYKDKREGRTSLNWSEKVKAFGEEAKDFKRVIVVVDALDEGSQVVQSRWQELKPLLDECRVSVMVTSRTEEAELKVCKTCNLCSKRYLNLYYVCYECSGDFHVCYQCRNEKEDQWSEKHYLMPAFYGEEVFLSVAPTDKAIRDYVKSEIYKEVRSGYKLRGGDEHYKNPVRTKTLGRICGRNPYLETEIIDTVCNRAHDKFLLAKLFVDTLKLKLNERDILQALHELPKGYADTYELTMQRIQKKKDADEHEFPLVISAVSWIVHASRALTVDELSHALATDVKDGFDRKAMYDRDTLLEVTCGLLVISENFVRLPHYTAQEYFNKEGSKWFQFNVPAKITRTCIQYMSTEGIAGPFDREIEPNGYEHRKQDFPFLAYAYEYWGDHAKIAESDPEASKEVFRFLTDADRLSMIVQALFYVESAQSARWEIRSGATALHVAAWFGLTGLIRLLVESKGLSVDTEDPRLRQTPLICAARRGHAESVKALLGMDADINKVSADDNTALFEAFSHDRIEVGQVLLERSELDINRRYSRYLDQAFLALIMKADPPSEVLPWLELVLQHKGDTLKVNQLDGEGRTALMLACNSGFHSVVKALVCRPDTNVNVAGNDGYTALAFAAGYKEDGIAQIMVRYLLEHGADPKATDKEGGGTPIIRAADKGNRDVIDIIHSHNNDLIHGVDAEKRGILHAAAINNRAELVSFIVQIGVDINVTDQKGRTPLHDAARFGYTKTINALLANGASSIQDNSKREPWMVAWENGQTHVLHSLKNQLPQDMSRPGTSSPLLDVYVLPLWSRVKRGEEDFVREFLKHSPRSFERSDNDPDSGNTAMHFAIKPYNLRILDLLLKTDISKTAPNDIGRTPLHTAAISTEHGALQSLLKSLPHKPSILDARDAHGFTPLQLAFAWRHMNLARNCCMLIEAGARLDADSMIIPLFFIAVEYGYIEAVKTLIENYNAPVTAKNRFGESAMHVAKVNGHKVLHKFLSSCNTIYAQTETPLSEKSEENALLSKVEIRPAFPQPSLLDTDKERVIFQEAYHDPEDLETKFPSVTESEPKAERVLIPA